MIDLDALEAAIAEGERKNLFVAPIVKELIAELREARGERVAVVEYLRSETFIMEFRKEKNLGRLMSDIAADAIERGEHRREEEK